MKKELICIECPVGCKLIIKQKGGKILNIKGNKCLKGLAYAQEETKNPKRVLTSTVIAIGSELKMLPVKTSGPIPKRKIFQAMLEIRKVRVRKPFKSSQVIRKDFMKLGVDLLATRDLP